MLQKTYVYRTLHRAVQAEGRIKRAADYSPLLLLPFRVPATVPFALTLKKYPTLQNRKASFVAVQTFVKLPWPPFLTCAAFLGRLFGFCTPLEFSLRTFNSSKYASSVASNSPLSGKAKHTQRAPRTYLPAKRIHF